MCEVNLLYFYCNIELNVSLFRIPIFELPSLKSTQNKVQTKKSKHPVGCNLKHIWRAVLGGAGDEDNDSHQMGEGWHKEQLIDN